MKEDSLSSHSGPKAGPAVADCSADTRADRGWYLSVQYAESRSRKFSEVLKQARECERFQALIDESGRVVYRNLVRRDRLPDFRPVFEALRALNCSLQCTIEGQEFSVDEVNSLLLCALPRAQQPRCTEFTQLAGPSYCLGCDRYLLFAPGTQGGEDGRFWWEFGAVDRAGVLAPDRKAMKDFLVDGTYTNAFCPMADRNLAFSIVDRIPRAIDVRKEFHWEVSYRHRLTESSGELFTRRWQAVPPSRRRPPSFGTQFVIRGEGERPGLVGFDGSQLGEPADDETLSRWLEAGEQFAGVVLSSTNRSHFEFGLLAEFTPVNGHAVPEGFKTIFQPENTLSYLRFLKNLFRR